MSLFTQIVILLLVLSCMVMLLLAIRQLSRFEGFDDEAETMHLREDVEEDGHILSKNSVFKTLVEAEPEEPNDIHKSRSKDPFSPRE